jgi:hypothetical protein
MVRYAVWINGDLTEPVIPTREIRQGDPISRYLFLLCTEGYLVFCNEGRSKASYTVYVMADLVPLFPIYCLQMIVYSSPVVMKEVLTLCSKLSSSIVRVLVVLLLSRSDERSRQFSSVPVVLLLSRPG